MPRMTQQLPPHPKTPQEMDDSELEVFGRSGGAYNSAFQQERQPARVAFVGAAPTSVPANSSVSFAISLSSAKVAHAASTVTVNAGSTPMTVNVEGDVK